MNREDSGEQMVIRKASGAGENADISGDYNVYNETSTVTVGEYTVTLKGNDQKVNLATWTGGDRCMAAFDFLVFCRRWKKGRDKGNACQNIGLYAGRRNHGPIWGYAASVCVFVSA